MSAHAPLHQPEVRAIPGTNQVAVEVGGHERWIYVMVSAPNEPMRFERRSAGIFKTWRVVNAERY